MGDPAGVHQSGLDATAAKMNILKHKQHNLYSNCASEQSHTVHVIEEGGVEFYCDETQHCCQYCSSV